MACFPEVGVLGRGQGWHGLPGSCRRGANNQSACSSRARLPEDRESFPSASISASISATRCR